MSQLEMYALLKGLGIPDEKAKAAVQDDRDLVTKEYLRDYLRAELHELRSSLLIWIFSMLVAFTGLVAALVRWGR